MWYGPFIVKKVLKKGAYALVDFEGNELAEPINGLYLKRYYSWASAWHFAFVYSSFYFVHVWFLGL